MQDREVGIHPRTESTDRLLEQVPALKLFETDDIPEQYTGVKRVEMKSPRYFTVVLDGIERNGNTLVITHPKPLTVYGVRGMRKVEYKSPENSAFPSADAVEIYLTPRNGELAVTSYETVPEETLLETQKATGTTVKREVYRDPRVVKLDGHDFPNVKTVQVRGLKEAEITLYKQ